MKKLVHLHLYYYDQLDFYLEKLSVVPEPFDLFVTMREQNDEINKKIYRFKHDAKILVTKNVGADVWPFISVLNSVNLDDYDYIIKVHTKRFINAFYLLPTGFQTHGWNWRNALTSFLTKTNIVKVFKAFADNKKLGMIADSRVILINYNKDKRTTDYTKEIMRKFGMNDKITHAAGTMFVVRAKLMQIIKTMNFKESDFSEFKSIQSGQLAHNIEQLLGSVVIAQGFEIQDVTTGIGMKIFWRIQRPIQKTIRFFFRISRDSNGVKIKILKIPIYIKRSSDA